MANRSLSSHPRRRYVPKLPPRVIADAPLSALNKTDLNSVLSKSVNSNESLPIKSKRHIIHPKKSKTSAELQYHPIPTPVKVQETARFMINLEDLVLLEEKLCKITEGLKLYRSSAYEFEEWWLLTTGNTLSRIYTLFRDDRVRKNIKEAMLLEVVSVSLAEFCFLIGAPPSMMLTQVQNLMFYVHQNFLVVVSFLLTRLPQETTANTWAQNLQLIIESKKVRRAKRCDNQDLLRQNNDVISNIIKNVCRMNVLRNTNQRARAYRVIVLAGMQVMRLMESLELEKVRSVMQQALDSVVLQGKDGGQIGSGEDIATEVDLPHVSPPFLPPLQDKQYTLILDLDETLVHYNENEASGQYVVRPGLQHFLSELSPLYDIIVFTAAMQEYADWVLDEIDVNHAVSNRLYRQHTVQAGNAFIKDLTHLGRDLSKVIIIDNVGENFQLQPGNGILIRSWFDDKEDAALKELLPLLKGE